MSDGGNAQSPPTSMATSAAAAAAAAAEAAAIAAAPASALVRTPGTQQKLKRQQPGAHGTQPQLKRPHNSQGGAVSSHQKTRVVKAASIQIRGKRDTDEMVEEVLAAPSDGDLENPAAPFKAEAGGSSTTGRAPELVMDHQGCVVPGPLSDWSATVGRPYDPSRAEEIDKAASKAVENAMEGKLAKRKRYQQAHRAGEQRPPGRPPGEGAQESSASGRTRGGERRHSTLDGQSPKRRRSNEAQ